MNAFQFIFQYIKRHKVQYTLGIITLFVVDFANIFIPKLTGVITDGLTAHSLDWSGVKSALPVSAWTAACGRPFLLAVLPVWSFPLHRKRAEKRHVFPSGKNGCGILQRAQDR